MKKTSVIELRKISKAFYGVSALVNVNLQVDRESVHALMGENSAERR